MATFSVRFYNSDAPNTKLSTQAYGKDEKEAKQRFKSANPKAVITEFRQIGG